MKKALLSLLFIIPILGFSQCPTGLDFYLSSQAEIDAFPVNYPDCTELDVFRLNISGDDITSLMPLSQLTLIENLSISSTSLTSLSGLENVDSYIGYDIQIWSNPFLVDISALSSIVYLPNFVEFVIQDNPLLASLVGLEWVESELGLGELIIRNNDSLTNLIGLDNENLQTLTGLGNLEFTSVFAIRDNPSLVNLGGLNSLTAANQLEIIRNNSLVNLDGLNNINMIYGLLIENNPNLAICNITSICTSLANWDAVNNPNNIIIENNASGCGSIAEVEYACNLVPRNDDCEGAIPLTLGETTVAYNELATESTQTPSCNDVNRADVWFTLNSGSFTTVDIIAEAGYFLQLWEGECASLTQVASACAESSLNDIPVTTNTDYIVQVWSDGTSRRSTGLFDILVQDGTLTTQEFAFTGFAMYPNPVNKMLNFKANQNITAISMYSLLGQAVLQVSPNSLQTELDLTHLQTGIYVVKVKIGRQEVTYKVVKE